MAGPHAQKQFQPDFEAADVTFQRARQTQRAFACGHVERDQNRMSMIQIHRAGSLARAQINA